MKFTLLDTMTKEHTNKSKIHHKYTDTYQYLDDLFDKTFITDYFMDKGSRDDSSTTNK
jgi:hypothetical protein